MIAALAPYIPASGPWARRKPNSMTSAFASGHIFIDFVAISVWWLIMFMNRSFHKLMLPEGRVTGSIGSLGRLFLLRVLPEWCL
jgi:hypothetical protein